MPEAVELLIHGVRSRRLAVAVANSARTSDIDSEELRAWLSDLGAPAWRTEFAAGPSEVGDLLQFVHDPAAAIGATLLDGETVTIPVKSAPGAWVDDEELAVVPSSAGEVPRPMVAVAADGNVVGRVRAAEHRHLAVLADVGFQLYALPASRNEDRVTEIQVRADIE